MISIIVCSRNKEYMSDLSANVEATIGVPYELVVVDNADNKFNIFSAYNYGVSISKGDVFLFAHEDIIIETEGWGKKIMAILDNDPEIGMVGIAGSQSVAKAPINWGVFGSQGDNSMMISDIAQYTGKPYDICDRYGEGYMSIYLNPRDEKLVEAKAVDGLLFAIRRELFDKGRIRFDEETYDGFHAYDMDISLQVGEHKKIAIFFDVTTRHLSIGNYNKDYYLSYFKYYRKWKDRLPVSVFPLTDRAVFNQRNALAYFRGMVKSGFFTLAQIRPYVNEYFDSIKGERKTRYYYSTLYYTKFYNTLHIGKAVSKVYDIYLKIKNRR